MEQLREVKRQLNEIIDIPVDNQDELKAKCNALHAYLDKNDLQVVCYISSGDFYLTEIVDDKELRYQRDNVCAVLGEFFTSTDVKVKKLDNTIYASFSIRDSIALRRTKAI